MATDAILSFENVVAGYGQQTILHGLTFSVRRGAITTVIGPNGAGKSTAFKAVFCLLRLQSGQVLLDGADVTNLSPAMLVQRSRGPSGHCTTTASTAGDAAVGAL